MFIPQSIDIRDTCWIASLATISGIDVELFNPEPSLAPGVWVRTTSRTGTRHIEEFKTTTGWLLVKPWEDLMKVNGYRLRRGDKSPKGVDFIQTFSVLSPSPEYDGIWNHAVAVNGKTGEVHDVAGGPIENINELEAYCNVVPLTRFWLEEI